MREADLKAALLSAADSMTIEPHVPGDTFKRAHRRRIRSIVASVAVMATLAGGGYSAVAFVRDSQQRPASQRCTPYLGPFELTPPGREGFLVGGYEIERRSGEQFLKGTSITYPVDLGSQARITKLGDVAVVSPTEAWQVGGAGDTHDSMRATSWHFADDSWRQVEVGVGSELNRVASGGEVTWASGEGKGWVLVRFVDGRWERTSTPTPKPPTNIAVDARGRAWITPAGTGLFVSRADGWARVELPRGVRTIRLLRTDGSRVWIVGDNFAEDGDLPAGAEPISIVALYQHGRWRAWNAGSAGVISSLAPDGRGGAWVVGTIFNPDRSSHSISGGRIAFQPSRFRGDGVFAAYANGRSLKPIPVNTSMYVRIESADVHAGELLIRGGVSLRTRRPGDSVNPYGEATLRIRGGCR